MIPRNARLAPWLAAAVLLAACGTERVRGPREGAAAPPESAKASATLHEPQDADSLTARVMVFDFVEAGGPAVVEVVGAHADSLVADVEQNAALQGGVGPYAFVKSWTYEYACGAHGNTTDSFTVVDLAHRRPVALLDDSARTAVERGLLDAARAAFKADSALDQLLDRDTVRLTLAYPLLAGERLGLTYQLTAAACYACSDGRWSSYTRSVLLPARTLPPLLEPFAATPIEVRTTFRILHALADSGAGWSEVVMAAQRRDALARLFGVTAPAGGREFLVWYRAQGREETVWVRGSGVEATIVGRQPGVWISAGGRAWSWRSRSVTVPTTPCGGQTEEKP